MRGYPKVVATRQDFINLLNMPEFRARALADLQAIYDANGATALRVVSGSEQAGDLVTAEIDNPMPAWKRKAFGSRDAVKKLMEESSSDK